MLSVKQASCILEYNTDREKTITISGKTTAGIIGIVFQRSFSMIQVELCIKFQAFLFTYKAFSSLLLSINIF